MAKVELLPATTRLFNGLNPIPSARLSRCNSRVLFPSGLCLPGQGFLHCFLLTSGCFLLHSSSRFYGLILKSIFIKWEISGLFPFHFDSVMSQLCDLGQTLLSLGPASLCVGRKGWSDGARLMFQGSPAQDCSTH